MRTRASRGRRVIGRFTGRFVGRFVERAAVIAVGLAVIGGGAGCGKKSDDGTSPTASQKSLPPLVIRDDTPDLMLTWVDEKGDTHVELKPTDVPAEGRERVRVVVSDREDGTRDLFYVVDLTKKQADGGYACETMRRGEWEAEIERRRAAYIAKFAPPPPPRASGDPAPTGAPPNPPPAQAGSLTVIIYGASWCRPCHDAEAYLKQKGVKVIMKDVEESAGAAAELRDKLEKSGQRGGSIPVIDVRGQILVGFSPGALDRALAKAQATTVL